MRHRYPSYLPIPTGPGAITKRIVAVSTLGLKGSLTLLAFRPASRHSGNLLLFSRITLWLFKAHSRAAAVLIDELHPSKLQGFHNLLLGRVAST